MIKAYRLAYYKRIQKAGIDTLAFDNKINVPKADFGNRETISYSQSIKTLNLNITATDSMYPLQQFNVWVNDSPVYGFAGISIPAHHDKRFDTTVSIVLSSGENRIETSATNSNGIQSYRLPLYVKYTPPEEIKPRVYFIGIGIDRFPDAKNNLRYCTKDVRDLATNLKKRYGRFVKTDTLFNQNVTLQNVKALREKLMAMQEDDIVILAYCGHGILNEHYDYFLSTYDINFSQPEINGIRYDEMEKLFDGIRTRKKLMLIDACHSGEIDKEDIAEISARESALREQNSVTLGNDKSLAASADKRLGLKSSSELMQELFANIGRGTGATVIVAASGAQAAYERGDLKNGVFSYSLLELLNRKKSVSINELKEHIVKRVSELTNKFQQPSARSEVISYDWEL